MSEQGCMHAAVVEVLILNGVTDADLSWDGYLIIDEALAAIRADAERERDGARATADRLAEALRLLFTRSQGHWTVDESIEAKQAAHHALAAYDAQHEAAGTHE